MGSHEADRQSKMISLDKKYKANKRLGLLGLQTSKKEKSTICLSSEDMALFVENRLEEEAKLQALEHIANCDLCYDEWLLLSEQFSETGSGSDVSGKLKKFSSPKFLTAIGSSLALAASVILYLTLPQQQLEEANLMIPDEELTSAKVEEQVDTEKIDVGDVLAPLLTEKSEKSDMAVGQPGTSKELRTSKQTMPSPVAPKARIMASKPSGDTERIEMFQQREMQSSMPTERSTERVQADFSKLLILFCQESAGAGESLRIFKGLQRKGRKYLVDSPSISKKQRQFLHELVKMKQISSDEIEIFCTEAYETFGIQPKIRD